MNIFVERKPNTEVAVGSVRFGNRLPLALIAGPCALESRGHALEMASALKEIAAKAGKEGLAVAKALGVDVDAAPQRPSGGHASGAQSHKPSILQDYERGRPMEVETQLIAPLALARMAKISTPTLDILVPLVAAKAAAKGLYSH